MFSSAAHSVVHFARRTVFATLCKEARYLSVSTVSSTKHFYSESVLFSEKPTKAAKAKNSNEKFEQSQLYPDELEKVNSNDLLEEYDLLMDDKIPSIQKDPRPDKVESVERKSEAVDEMPPMQEVQRSVWPESVTRKSEAVDEMPPMQEVQRSVWPESVTRKSEAVDKMPPMQEVQRSVWPESVTRKSEAVDGVKISEQEEIDMQENDLGERLSDSDSESEPEDMSKRISNRFQVNLNNLKITKLSRRSRFFRENMEKAKSKKDGLIVIDEIGGIFELARLGVTPEALFFYSPEVLKSYPADLSNTALYNTPIGDMKYWSSKVRFPDSAIIGLYKKEALRLKTTSSEAEMPLTIICDQIWHRIGFTQILSSVSITPPKLLITSEACVYPWHGTIVRNSLGAGVLLNHDFGLTWEEMRQKIDMNDRIYILELYLSKDYDRDGTESQWSSLPSVYLYEHSFWDKGNNVTLIVTRSHSKNVSEELSTLCFERKALRIDAGLTKRSFGLATFHMVFFELRRQWLAAENGSLCKSGSKNGKTPKSRVRIVSTLIKT